MKIQEQKWEMLVNKTRNMLEKIETMPKFDQLLKQEPVVRLWHYSSNDKNRSWFIYQPLPKSSTPNEAYVRCQEWDLLKDRQLIFSLLNEEELIKVKPSLTLIDTMIPNDQIYKMIVELGNVDFEIEDSNFDENSNSDIFGIEGIGRYQATPIIWQHPIPSLWQPIGFWFSNMVELISSHTFDSENGI